MLFKISSAARNNLFQAWVGIRYYGLAYLLGFLGAWLLLKLYNNKGKFGIDANAQSSLMTAIIIGVLAGGRLGYMLLYDLEAFLANPLLVFRVDQGGMASHGGFVGVSIALLWYARKQNLSFLEVGDVVVILSVLSVCAFSLGACQPGPHSTFLVTWTQDALNASRIPGPRDVRLL